LFKKERITTTEENVTRSTRCGSRTCVEETNPLIRGGANCARVGGKNPSKKKKNKKNHKKGETVGTEKFYSCFSRGDSERMSGNELF